MPSGDSILVVAACCAMTLQFVVGSDKIMKDDGTVYHL